MIITEKGLPVKCEYCDCNLEWDGVDLVCTNPYCLKIGYEAVKSWCINIAPIDNLGWKTIEKILNQYFPPFDWTIDGLYNLTPIVKIGKEGSERDLFNKMLNKLHDKITVSQFLLALNIPGLGKIGAKAVENHDCAKQFIESIINFDRSYIDEFGYIIQNKNVAKFCFYEYKSTIEHCYNLVKDQITFDSRTLDANDVKEKGKVVITGKLSMKRADFENILKQNGWSVVSKVNKDVKYLITNTPDSNTVKNKEADVLGIEKINEENFIKIMED